MGKQRKLGLGKFYIYYRINVSNRIISANYANKMTNSSNREKKIRLLLNDFFQDIDTEAKIDSELANKIIDVHLVKFSTILSQTREEARREEEQRWINQPANEHDNKIKEHLLREIMEEMPKKIDCDETTGEMPTDPGLSADQARNFTIDQVNTLLERKLSTVKK